VPLVLDIAPVLAFTAFVVEGGGVDVFDLDEVASETDLLDNSMLTVVTYFVTCVVLEVVLADEWLDSVVLVVEVVVELASAATAAIGTDLEVVDTTISSSFLLFSCLAADFNFRFGSSS